MTKSGASPLSQAEAFRKENVECARLVIARPERYGRGMQEWARLVLGSREAPAVEHDGQRRLFSGEVR